jgi:hypothetical protein
MTSINGGIVNLFESVICSLSIRAIAANIYQHEQPGQCTPMRLRFLASAAAFASKPGQFPFALCQAQLRGHVRGSTSLRTWLHDSNKHRHVFPAGSRPDKAEDIAIAGTCWCHRLSIRRRKGVRMLQCVPVCPRVCSLPQPCDSENLGI